MVTKAQLEKQNDGLNVLIEEMTKSEGDWKRRFKRLKEASSPASYKKLVGRLFWKRKVD
tara:strand:+ start:2466 stop:2642 length:177 start_codon:yes stop_codon:yes gene_type:complete